MKKGLKTLIVGIVIFILGAFVVPFAFILPFILGDSEKDQFIIPGETKVSIDEPGRYYLWNDHQTVYEGSTYNRSEKIPDGLQIIIQDQLGRNLSFTSNTSISTSSGSSAKNTIGYVEVEDQGELYISVTGDTEERVFSLSRFGLMKVFGLIFAAIVTSLLITLIGIGIGIWGIVKLANDKSQPSDAGSSA